MYHLESGGLQGRIIPSIIMMLNPRKPIQLAPLFGHQ